MQGQYKVPGGKLVVVDLVLEQGCLRQVQVSGDFFIEPDSALDAINMALEGQPVDAPLATLMADITAALPDTAQLYGITAEGVAIAVQRALANGGQA